VSSQAYGPEVENLGHEDVQREILPIPDRRQLYGIPPGRVIGSALGLTYREAGDSSELLYKAAVEFFDDGPEKPVRIWSRIGRRPLLAFGNSNGDIPMLAFAGGPDRPALRLLLLHDDRPRVRRPRRRRTGPGPSRRQRLEVVSIRHDWQVVVAGPPP
jgi:hypothetical protein